ncbi:hypothetical protein VII00023_11269 [Vibrio ichthyoenteri ATCC 700023]|uniref:Uncharacterized protein n=1 Tax=Vibrio ichthyoenteri ATCC 700023 TaxID=870968 RepID=F9S5L0_9VIBR|nr:hypothetical protein VII00023_11269 [Vibrio ichthyoenteri ATCC 700023]
MDQIVGKAGVRCDDPANNDKKIVNNLDLIHWITDQSLVILVINR